jgi:transposase
LHDSSGPDTCPGTTTARPASRHATTATSRVGRPARPELIDGFLAKVEEWIERSNGKLRAHKAHKKLLLLGYAGSERTTRRAVARVKKDYRLGRVRVHRPWVTEPGMWLQYDFGDGPVIDGVKTTLFCVWLAWSRFRVVLAIRDKTSPSVMAALDVTLRRLGGAPTYVLTDNEKTVTTAHVAGIAVRNQDMVAFARHAGSPRTASVRQLRRSLTRPGSPHASSLIRWVMQGLR